MEEQNKNEMNKQITAVGGGWGGFRKVKFEVTTAFDMSTHLFSHYRKHASSLYKGPMVAPWQWEFLPIYYLYQQSILQDNVGEQI